MDPSHVLVFAGGLIVGVLVALLLGVRLHPLSHPAVRAVPPATISSWECQNGNLVIQLNLPDAATLPEGYEVCALHSHVYQDGVPGEDPHDDAQEHEVSGTITHTGSGTVGLVAVWTEACDYGKDSTFFNCNRANNPAPPPPS